MTMPRESPIGWAAVPLLEMLKLPRLRCALLPPLSPMSMALVPNRFVASKPRMMLPVMAITLVASPGMPTVASGPLAVVLPYLTSTPPSLGKLRIVLPLIAALVRLATAEALPMPISLTPDPFEVAVLVVLVIVLFWIVASLIVPVLFWMSMPLSKALVRVLFVTASVPARLPPSRVPLPLNAMLDSPSASPELLSVPLANVKFETPVPLIPLPPVLWTFRFVNDGLVVVARLIP